MDKEFWLDRWKEHQIGFHNSEYNSNLINHFDRLNLRKGDHVFVPLCGKSLDMIWLMDQGYKVTGIELSPIAIEEFFAENKIEFKKTPYKKFIKYTSENITLFEGDIFDLTKEDLGEIKAIYDRAATVALPLEMRVKYLDKLKELSSELDILMVLFEYDQYLVSGPPFSVPEVFIRNKFAEFKIEKLKSIELMNRSPKFAEVNARVWEKVFLIEG